MLTTHGNLVVGALRGVRRCAAYGAAPASPSSPGNGSGRTRTAGSASKSPSAGDQTKVVTTAVGRMALTGQECDKETDDEDEEAKDEKAKDDEDGQQQRQKL